jgi:hypothetical protein
MIGDASEPSLGGKVVADGDGKVDLKVGRKMDVPSGDVGLGAKPVEVVLYIGAEEVDCPGEQLTRIDPKIKSQIMEYGHFCRFNPI